jgi:lysylphosphatidylglycerol synthetase-like protein (DUF2156 family)
MADSDDEPETRIRHPNREKSSSQVTKAFVALLLLASAALITIVTIGGWSALQGAQFLAALYIIVYLVMAYFVMKWSRGVLPMAAAFGIGLAVFAVIAAPGWFYRAHSGYADPGLPPRLLGLLTILLAIVELILIIAALIGFSQKWNLEVEEEVDHDEQRGGYGGGQPAAATG